MKVNPVKYLLLFICIADTYGGLLQGILPVSAILRFTFLIFAFWYLASIKYLKISSSFFVLFVYLTLMSILAALREQNINAFVMAMISSLKFIYPIMLYLVIRSQLNIGVLSRQYLINLFMLYFALVTSSILIGYFSGLGALIGGRSTLIEGNKGFMIGANEVGLMLLISGSVVYAEKIAKLNIISFFVIFSASIVSGALVFTKSSLAYILITFYFLPYYLRKMTKATRYSLICLLPIAVIYPLYTFSSRLVELVQSSFLAVAMSGNFILFIFRGRDTYVAALKPMIFSNDFHLFNYMFGFGEFHVRQASILPLGLRENNGTNFEMDLFDVISSYGLVGLILYLICLRPMARDLISKSTFGSNHFKYIITVALIAHSILAGHVLFSPQVSSLLVLFLLVYSGFSANWSDNLSSEK